MSKRKGKKPFDFRRLPEMMTTIYILVMLMVYPLFLGGNDLSNVMQPKYTFFLAASLVYLGVLILTLLSLLLMEEYKGVSPKQLWQRVTLTQKAILAYMAVAILSSILSPYPDVFFGISQEGLLTTLLYCLIFLAVSAFARFKSIYVYAFGLSMTALCVIMLLQWAGHNPFSLYPAVESIEKTIKVFIGTIGNADFVSTMFCLSIPMFITSIVYLRERWKWVLALPLLLCLYCMARIDVNSGTVGLVGFILIVGCLAFKSKRSRKIAGTTVSIGLAAVVILTYFYDYGQRGIFYEVHQMLHGIFKNSFGSWRIFIWGRTLPLIMDYPVWGSGPDTFLMRFMPEYFGDLGGVTANIQTSAHNEYLNIIINLGFWGLAAYLSAIISQTIRVVKRSLKEPQLLILYSSMACYFVQAFFNISIVIVAPIFFIFFGMLEGTLNHTEKL